MTSPSTFPIYSTLPTTRAPLPSVPHLVTLDQEGDISIVSTPYGDAKNLHLRLMCIPKSPISQGMVPALVANAD